ncbi:hypothetical protein MYAM1_002091 [Malassezia yamatoensis]|uniref:THO complex subunit 1 n=1 Tax=Malassezia yamatoensis TaxID=253288 RepID=A0AAJ5YT81_9BASI|nr:hypothetical protein MYAM1_002091 [Malassezia yamatoensis]
MQEVLTELDKWLPALLQIAEAQQHDVFEQLAQEIQPLSQSVKGAYDALCHAQSNNSGEQDLQKEALTTAIHNKVSAFVLEGSIQSAPRRLDVALSLEHASLVDAALPLTALEEWMEQTTTLQCSELFLYLEANAERFTKGMVATSGKGLVLLRLCNELLRRLSSSYRPHTVLSGRVLSFVSMHFPINERSGVNLKGEFHTENYEPVTSIDSEWDDGGVAEQQITSNDSNTPISPASYASHPAFYSLFWNLQKCFAHPSVLIDESNDEQLPFASAAKAMQLSNSDDTQMQIFQKAADCVLSVLQNHNKNESVPSQRVYTEVASESEVFPSFLKGTSLLKYELSDPLFRRHILTQFLILFQYLLGCSPSSRDRYATWTNKALVPRAELNESDEKWTRRAWRHVQTQLRDTGTDGREYLAMVLQILRKESCWLNWKAIGAPALEKAASELLDVNAIAEKEYAAFQNRLPAYPHPLGTPALSMLWSEGFQASGPCDMTIQDENGQTKTYATDGLEDLEMPPRPPALASFSRSIHMEEQRAKQRQAALGQDAAQDQELLHKQNTQQSLAWRALRCKDQFPLHLVACMKTIDDIPGLLDAIHAEKHGKDFHVPVLHEADEQQDRSKRDAEAQQQEKQQAEAEQARLQAEELASAQQQDTAIPNEPEQATSEMQIDQDNHTQPTLPSNAPLESNPSAETGTSTVDDNEEHLPVGDEASSKDPQAQQQGQTSGESVQQHSNDSPHGPPSTMQDLDGDHDTDNEAGFVPEMDLDTTQQTTESTSVQPRSTLHLSTQATQLDDAEGMIETDGENDADATFMTAPRASASSAESSRESTPQPLRSEG